MRLLQRDVHDAKPLAQRRGDRSVAHRLVHPAPPQAPHHRRDAHHHVQRVGRFEVRPRRVPLACSSPLRLATGATASATSALAAVSAAAAVAEAAAAAEAAVYPVTHYPHAVALADSRCAFASGRVTAWAWRSARTRT